MGGVEPLEFVVAHIGEVPACGAKVEKLRIARTARTRL
jgi:hypothetical protein